MHRTSAAVAAADIQPATRRASVTWPSQVDGGYVDFLNDVNEADDGRPRFLGEYPVAVLHCNHERKA